MATKYLIFKDVPEPVGSADAASGNAAIRAYLNGTSKVDGDGQFVAIPARSFKPVTVKIERTVKVG